MSYVNGVSGSQQYTAPVEAPAAAAVGRGTGVEAATPSGPSLSGSTPTSSVDRANLSSTSAVLAQAFSGSDVRTDKVASLQQAIAAGTYQVPSSDVASKIISSLLS